MDDKSSMSTTAYLDLELTIELICGGEGKVNPWLLFVVLKVFPRIQADSNETWTQRLGVTIRVGKSKNYNEGGLVVIPNRSNEMHNQFTLQAVHAKLTSQQ